MTEPVARRVPPWLVVLIGLGVIAVAFVGGHGPYHDGREYHRVDACERGPGAADCFGREPVTIVGRRTYIRVRQDEDSESRVRVWEVTWERADGTRVAREVTRRIHDAAAEGTAADLRTWRGEVVGIEVGGVDQWFTPRVGWSLAGWLGLGWLGLGIVLWGLFDRWWDGVFMLVFRGFFWLMTGFVPVVLGMVLVLYGVDTDMGGQGRYVALALALVVALVGFPAAILASTFRDR